jgi:hypothetical protein
MTQAVAMPLEPSYKPTNPAMAVYVKNHRVEINNGAEAALIGAVLKAVSAI